MRGLRVLALVLVAGILGSAVVVVAFARGDDAHPAASATIGMEYSKFSVKTVTVRAGTPVEITLVNRDPIGHEWIVGDPTTHARHRTGTEPYHDQVPTEVSLRAYETKTTVVAFDTPGEYSFVCHLPGHEEYGMKGTIRVVE